MKIGVVKANSAKSKIKFNCSFHERSQPKTIKVPSNIQNCSANKQTHDLVWLEGLVTEIQSYKKHTTTFSEHINQNQAKLNDKGGSQSKVSNNFMCKNERKILGDLTEKLCNQPKFEADEVFQQILIETTRGKQNKSERRKDQKPKKALAMDLNARNIQKKMDDCMNKKFHKVSHVKSARVQGQKAVHEVKMKENSNMKSKSKFQPFQVLQNNTPARKSIKNKVQKTNKETVQRDPHSQRTFGKIIKNKIADFSNFYIETQNNVNAFNEKEYIEVFSSIEMKTSGGSLFSLKQQALGEILSQKKGSVKKQRCISSQKFSLKKMIDEEEIALQRKQRRFNSSFGQRKRELAKNQIVVETASTENENVLFHFGEDIEGMNGEEDISNIFKRLDGKGTGYLCVDNCYKQRISQQMRYVLSPVIQRIMEGTRRYSFSEFILQVQKSLETVHIQAHDKHNRDFKREVSQGEKLIENRQVHEKELNKAIEIGEFKEDGSKKHEKIIRFATFQDENRSFQVCPKFIEPQQLEAIQVSSCEERETDFIKVKVSMKNSILTYDSDIIKLEEMKQKIEAYFNNKQNKK